MRINSTRSDMSFGKIEPSQEMLEPLAVGQFNWKTANVAENGSVSPRNFFDDLPKLSLTKIEFQDD